MNPVELVEQIKLQLQEIAIREAQNQQEQAVTKKRVEQLEREIQQQYRRQSQLDNEAIELYRQSEELKVKLDKLHRIVILSQEFQNLQAECQDNQELLQILYSSISRELPEKVSSIEETEIKFPKQDNTDTVLDSPLTIATIKTALPNAEQVYKKLLARYLSQYHVFQNSIVDELDLIWWSVAFIAFGRSFYYKLSLKHHPDLDGSQYAMQLINTAWEISQDYINNAQ
jgi:hypothetical protein